MKISERACPDCKSPARGNPCWYYLDGPFAQTGADPPCSDYVFMRERRFGYRWIWVMVAAVLVLIAVIAKARAQEHHAQHHPSYQNWINQADKGCCNNQDCGELADADERTISGKLEVRIEGQWCVIQPWHYLKRGNAPNAASAHICVQRNGEQSACDRLLCYQQRPGT